ncbi:MAG: hypothetical protein A2020_08695 [Lentisphaerae bacterium GWF2_45_14]|nr:MAG: hypothetical protein A2020_08695 [Lentisphaerae bacterium GWF2_45_14]
MSSKPIIAVGLNPAWQKTLVFEKLRFYEVNRAKSAVWTASGKGINFVRATGNWGKTDSIVYQFAGGENGAKIVKCLEDEGLKHHSANVATETRICSTCLCLESGKMTELIEPSGTISGTESASLLQDLKNALPSSLGLSLCGTYPPGITEDFYKEAAREAARLKLPVLMDAWMNVNSVIEEGSVDVLKINMEEFFALTKCSDIESALKQCFKSPVKITAVTAGPGNAYLGAEGKIWEYKIPRLGKIINPIGAGDTVSAVFFSELVTGAEPHEAFASGLAAASASCLTPRGGEFCKEKALKIRENMSVVLKKLN